jgi:hypothetical protein
MQQGSAPGHLPGFHPAWLVQGWLSYHQYHLADDLLAVTEHLLQESGQMQVNLALQLE